VHSDTVVITWVVMAITLLAVALLSFTRSSIVLNKRYSLMELVVTTIGDMVTGILGKNGRPWVPFIISVFMFIFFMNEIGFIPFPGKSPTSDINTTFALAITAFVLFQFAGIKNHGLGYYKHLLVRPLALGIPLLPLNIIDELARPVTLAMRLFGNIFAGEVLMLVVIAIILAHIFIGVVPVSTLAYAGPFIVNLFNLAIGLIQAVVFTLLSIAYLINATAESSEH
jgi:F-type H+-transporting ATPase subunit a